MSSPTRYARWRIPILQNRLGYTEEPEPDPDPEDPTDYAHLEEGAAVQVALDIGEVAIVNDFRIQAATGNPDWSSDFTPTVNNVLLVFAFHRNAGQFPADTGWTRIAQVGPTVTSGDVSVACYAKVSAGSETTMEYAPGNATARDFIILEISGVTLADVETNTNSGSTTSITTGSVTPPSGRAGIIIGASAATPDEILGQSHTPGGDYTELYDSAGTAAPFETLFYQIEASTSGSYNPDTTINSLAVGHTWRGLTVALTPSTSAVWTQAPAANDGDDATYDEWTALIDDAFAQIALTVERLIYRAEARVAYSGSGSKTIEVYGSTDAAFTSPVLLGSETFSATGSDTPDEVAIEWTPTATYQYFRLQGVDDAGRLHDLNLYSAAGLPGGGVTDHGELSGLADDDHPQYATNVELTAHIDDAADAHDASAVSLLDTAGWFTGTEVEAGMAEHAARTIGYEDHGNMGAAETFDAATGWHSGTFDANCTFTLTAAASGTASSLFLELTQSTGGHTLTLPSSVVNKAAIEAAQDTTAGTTSFLVLLSRDGGTNWYGGWWGTDEDVGGTDLTVLDADTTVTPTSTISLVGTGPVSVDVTDGGDGIAVVEVSVGPTVPTSILLASDHATPFTFDEILQASDGSDFLYASE